MGGSLHIDRLCGTGTFCQGVRHCHFGGGDRVGQLVDLGCECRGQGLLGRIGYGLCSPYARSLGFGQALAGLVVVAKCLVFGDLSREEEEEVIIVGSRWVWWVGQGILEVVVLFDVY